VSRNRRVSTGDGQSTRDKGPEAEEKEDSTPVTSSKALRIAYPGRDLSKPSFHHMILRRGYTLSPLIDERATFCR
jgi:hypothetical protein